MKGAIKLFTDYTLTSEKGRIHRYDYSKAVASGYQQGDKFYFVLEISDRAGRQKFQTTELANLLIEIKAYAPAADWELVKIDG